MTMNLQCQQEVSLLDGQARVLGQVRIDRIQGDLVFGRFTAGPAYAEVEPLFTEYVEAANEQVLSIVGRLDEAIARLNLHLHSADAGALPAIYDVHIGAGSITFRVRTTVTQTGAPGGTAADLPVDQMRSDAPTG